MKKRRIVFQCLSLVAAILAFGAYWTYARSLSDPVGPEITIDDGILELSVQDPSSAFLQGVTAYDEHDGDVTSLVVVESIYGITDDHLTTVTYAAFDHAGNVAKAQRNVRFTDYEPPKFTLDCSPVLSSDSTSDMMDLIGATDVLDGNVGRHIHATIVSNTGTLRDEGIHQIQLQVTNSLGDTAQIEIPVEIYAPGKYNAALSLSQYILYLPQGAAFEAEDYLSSFTYLNTAVDLSGGMPENFTLKINDPVHVHEPGVYTVSYTVSYTISQSLYTGYSKMIVIIEK